MRYALVLAAALLPAITSPALLRAQQAELQVGAIGAWGGRGAYQGGGGGSLALVGGRVLYLGGRLVYFFGTTTEETVGTDFVTQEVRTSVLTGELGAQVPSGPFELLVTVGLGAAKFRQKVERQQGSAEPTTDEQKKTEFLFVPGLAVTLPVGPLRFAAEAQYYLAGDPDFYEGFKSNSLVLSARVILAIPVKLYPVAM